ncbi:uncharacterized protein LOC119672221 [Teleopsis dalmanni]|uniref:uncharacterized protein LOC119672221 n=1 Tax=Teleopsis dalmanni TaxID=139649 RepID=UPI0018CDD7BA|nr:uncharacterized protein LOC119672221 [Teleopsis dalmanni]
MSSPKDYTAPYGKSEPKYASQSEDYISLEMGGPGQTPSSSNMQQHPYRRPGRFFSTPAKSMNRNFEAEKNIPFYRNNQNRPHRNKFNNFRKNNRNSEGYQKFEQINNRIDVSYYHPTMVEDPWVELMERHTALKKSAKLYNNIDDKNDG